MILSRILPILEIKGIGPGLILENEGMCAVQPIKGKKIQ